MGGRSVKRQKTGRGRASREAQESDNEDNDKQLPSRLRAKSTKGGNSGQANGKAKSSTAKLSSIESYFSRNTQVRAQNEGAEIPENLALGLEEDDIQDDDETPQLKHKDSNGNRAVERAARSFVLSHKSSSSFDSALKTSFTSQKSGSSGLPQTDARAPASSSSLLPAAGLTWAEHYRPIDVSELAVHKKKVEDVRLCLRQAFELGQPRLIILKGPPGCGKTTTVKVLRDAENFDITEWDNPLGTYNGLEYVSISARFEEFLNRSSSYQELSFSSVPQSKPPEQERCRKVILLEEFPSTLSRNASSLENFRSAVLQYLSQANMTKDESTGASNRAVMVMVISEAASFSSTSVDHLTVFRLLGQDILNHHQVATVEFNPLAPSLLLKALKLVLKKIAKDTGRQKVPGDKVLESLGKAGDLRSALTSLEFLCTKGESEGSWSGNIKAQTSRSKPAPALTGMEIKALEEITHRESTLEFFHAVGKVLYNKRIESEGRVPSDHQAAAPDKQMISEVDVEKLFAELGTDTSTFLAALHENYLPSCNGDDFIDLLNGCIDVISDGDLLSITSFRSSGSATASPFGRANWGIDQSLQEEMCFHVCSQGLLHNLPYPVKRQNKPSGSMSKALRDPFKMYYPTSAKLWKDIEELDGLVASLSIRGNNDSFGSRSTQLSSFGSSMFQSLASQKVGIGDSGGACSNALKTDFILYEAPYLALNRSIELQNPALHRALKRISAVDTPADDSSLASLRKGRRPPFTSPMKKSSTHKEEDHEERFVLSDDDIEDN